jgi:hypothetical protein
MTAGRVDFFIAGVQKAGTTALAAYLARHSQIQMSRAKEVHHFDDEDNVDWSMPDHARLHRQFDWALDGVIRGEATPIYTYWPPALSRLKTYNPRARIIVGLRHPVRRAYSHWKMETARNSERLPFTEAISPPGRERVRASHGSVHRTFSYIERGFYSHQIARLLDLFPRGQVFFYRSDHLWSNPWRVLRSVEGFLTVDPEISREARSEYIVPLDTRSAADLPRWLCMAYGEQFRDDIVATASLTGLALDDWLDPEYQEPMGTTGRCQPAT